MEKNVRINKRNVKCWISRVILGSLTHAGMPAEASTVSIKPSVFGESLKIKDHGTLMWSSHFLRISNHRFKLWLHVHVQGNGDELKHRDIGDNLVQTNLARGRGHVKATYSLLRISSSIRMTTTNYSMWAVFNELGAEADEDRAWRGVHGIIFWQPTTIMMRTNGYFE